MAGAVMGEKRDIYRSYGQKLISLFVRLLFSGESYSLTELSRLLDCSKQTVLRLLNDITMAYGVNLEESIRGNRKFVCIRRPDRIPAAHSLTEMELALLHMCRNFTAHLLGKKLFGEATRALCKSQVLLPDSQKLSANHFAVFRPGTINYTPHYGIICALIRAMDEKKICRLSYKAIMERRSKTFYIKPLKIFSHNDTMYLLARYAREPGKPFREPDYDPLLAVHRMQKVEITDRQFEMPVNLNFDKLYNQHFGIMKGDAFQVEVEFTGWSARYVAERNWSPDQSIRKIGADKMRLIFCASSEPEVLSWVLSFGEEAVIVRPKRLAEQLSKKIKRLQGKYSNAIA
jgi:predicted DNA-binding transcriptional regulator YafY